MNVPLWNTNTGQATPQEKPAKSQKVRVWTVVAAGIRLEVGFRSYNLQYIVPCLFPENWSAAWLNNSKITNLIHSSSLELFNARYKLITQLLKITGTELLIPHAVGSVLKHNLPAYTLLCLTDFLRWSGKRKESRSKWESYSRCFKVGTGSQRTTLTNDLPLGAEGCCFSL